VPATGGVFQVELVSIYLLFLFLFVKSHQAFSQSRGWKWRKAEEHAKQEEADEKNKTFKELELFTPLPPPPHLQKGTQVWHTTYTGSRRHTSPHQPTREARHKPRNSSSGIARQNPASPRQKSSSNSFAIRSTRRGTWGIVMLGGRRRVLCRKLLMGWRGRLRGRLRG
jgi:hypothetical protein